MKNNKTTIIICVALVLVIVIVAGIFLLVGRRGVDKEYEYNTKIVTNTNAPVEGEPNLEAITGFVEDTKHGYVKLPFNVPDTPLQVLSVGKYTGLFNDDVNPSQVEDIFALVVKNTSEKVVSYSTFTIEYDEGKTCSFCPSNIPPNQSVLVFTNGETVPYKNVKSFTCTDSMAILAKSLPMLEGTVGVDFKNGEFIVTNLTSDNLGDVYIRYKACTKGNTYLGGITYSVVVKDVQPYETYKVVADNFDEETSVIIAVESIVS